MKRKITCRNDMLYCFYCKRRLNRFTRTIDHLVPLARGGLNRIYNRVYCCKECNNDKGDMTLKEYRLYLKLKQSYSGKALREACEARGILFNPIERRERNYKEKLERYRKRRY